MSWDALFCGLDASRAEIDAQAEEFFSLAVSHRNRIYCEKGCCNCCALAVNCSFPEALAISGVLTVAQQQTLVGKIPTLRTLGEQATSFQDFLGRFRAQLGGCPFLDHLDGCCGIYPVRPFSCRALLSTRNSSWCAVDFAGLHPLEKEAFLSSLDPDLVAFPTHYLAASQKVGLALELRTIAAMHASFGFGLSGNLIYQVWLEQEHQLSRIIPAGFTATLGYLEKNRLNLPLLLNLQGG